MYICPTAYILEFSPRFGWSDPKFIHLAILLNLFPPPPHFQGFRIADTFVHGEQTLGENIADFGGVKISLRAFGEWHKVRERETLRACRWPLWPLPNAPAAQPAGSLRPAGLVEVVGRAVVAAAATGRVVKAAPGGG